MMVREDDPVAALLEAAAFDASPRGDDPAAWAEVWQALPYQGVAYAAPMLDYQHAYLRGAGWELRDASLVLRTDRRPCGLWPLTLGGPAGSPRLTSAGAAVLAPLFLPGLSPRTVKKICSRAIAFMRALCLEHGLPAPVAEQPADPGLEIWGTSEWHQQLLATGATVSLRHDLYTDLNPDLADIRAGFRKSYRALINAGLRNWNVFVLDQEHAGDTVWSEFRRLHHDAAGRATRGDETWALQYAMLGGGDAFLVGLRDPLDSRLVGAGFFQCTRDEALYAVGAYDRSLFDKPLGHVVQQRAIETMKERGLRWYRIGERHYAQDRPAPTPKQVAIAVFKHGFASHLFCRVEYALPLSDPGNEATSL